MLTSAAWADPHQLHPWFRMPSQKRKDLSDDDENMPRATYELRHSLSPPPRSPKRRRCDVLESGMSQLTLGGLPFGAPAVYHALVGDASLSTSSSYLAPAIQSPSTPASASTLSQPRTDGPRSPYVTHIPVKPTTPVTLPGSVEEPASPEAIVSSVPDIEDVSMKAPSWYEIEKDRTSDSLASLAPATTLPANASPSPRSVRPPPRYTVADVPHNNTGIVITELEDSDAEDEDGKTSADIPASFKISPALLDRLPKHHTLGPIALDPGLAGALVLYRPLVVPDEAEEEARRREAERARETEKEKQREARETTVPDTQPMGEEEPMEEDTRPSTPMVESVEPVDEPMDIEML